MKPKKVYLADVHEPWLYQNMAYFGHELSVTIDLR
jgi:hypothetical protein